MRKVLFYTKTATPNVANEPKFTGMQFACNSFSAEIRRRLMASILIKDDKSNQISCTLKYIPSSNTFSVSSIASSRCPVF